MAFNTASARCTVTLWEVLHRINRRLVYGGSGYGVTGPDRDKLTMDLTIQAVSGPIAATGFPEGPLVKAGPAVVDFISGIRAPWPIGASIVIDARGWHPGPPCKAKGADPNLG